MRWSEIGSYVRIPHWYFTAKCKRFVGSLWGYFIRMNDMRDGLNLILASGSPRRWELLALTGWRASVMPVEIDENPHKGESAPALSTRLAKEKARLASEQVDSQSIVVAADTVVRDRDRILGKPAGAEQARKILIDLRGRQHDVYTTLALVETRSNREVVDLCKTSVPMRAYELEELETYIATGDPMDKAGAYAIQDPSFHPVDVNVMDGCFANVMGLPLCHLTRSMRFLGIAPLADVPLSCQSFTGYACPVYKDILGNQP